jgi:hypothetical protein
MPQQPTERRCTDRAQTELRSAFHDLVREIKAEIASLTENGNRRAEVLLDVQQKVNLLLSAFVPGKMVEHRLYHERQDAREHDEHAFSQSLKRGLMQSAILAFAATVVGVLAFAVNAYLSSKGIR